MEARSLEYRVASLEERVERWETLQEGVNATLLLLFKELNEFKEEVRERFTRQDQRMTRLEDRMTGVEQGLLEVARNQQKMEEILVIIMNKLD